MIKRRINNLIITDTPKIVQRSIKRGTLFKTSEFLHFNCNIYHTGACLVGFL